MMQLVKKRKNIISSIYDYANCIFCNYVSCLDPDAHT